MIRSYVRFALHSLRTQRIRTWLTVLGVVIGVGAVVALISITDGLARAARQQYESLGVDTITVAHISGVAASGPPFDPGLLAALPQIEQVERWNSEIASVTTEGFAGQAFLYINGLGPGALEHFPRSFGGFQLREGRAFEPGEEFVLVLDERTAEDLRVTLGDPVRIEETEFELIGVLKQETYDAALELEDRAALYVPIAGLDALYAERNPLLERALVKVSEGTDIRETAEQIEMLYASQGREVATFTPLDLFEDVADSLQNITRVLVVIAAIALFVGGVGIMNTMYTAILERTVQIGVMKAIGAKNRQILALFWFESALLGSLGGILGVAAGIGLGITAGRMIAAGVTAAGGFFLSQLGLEASYGTFASPILIVGALAASFLLGGIAGILPAWRAGRMNPVSALRYE